MLVNIRLFSKVYAYSFVHIFWWFLLAPEGEKRKRQDKGVKSPGSGMEKSMSLTLFPKLDADFIS